MFLFLSTCSYLLFYWFFHIILLFFRYVFAQLRLVKKAWSKILYSKYCILYITVHKCFSHSSLPVERFSFNVFWPGIRVLIIIPQLKGNIINKIRETGGCLSFISALLLFDISFLRYACLCLSVPFTKWLRFLIWRFVMHALHCVFGKTSYLLLLNRSH